VVVILVCKDSINPIEYLRYSRYTTLEIVIESTTVPGLLCRTFPNSIQNKTISFNIEGNRERIYNVKVEKLYIYEKILYCES